MVEGFSSYFSSIIIFPSVMARLVLTSMDEVSLDFHLFHNLNDCEAIAMISFLLVLDSCFSCTSSNKCLWTIDMIGVLLQIMFLLLFWS